MRIGSFGFDRCFIVAELSANHNGSLKLAIETIKAAKRAGADAIKLQTYTADTITLNVRNDDFRIKGTIWNDKYLYDLYKEAFTPWDWHPELFRVAREEGLECFSSPFDLTSVDFLEDLQVPCYKIASFEISDIPLIKYVAQKKKPVILSTGVAHKDDIQLALDSIRSVGNNDILLLKCTSSYPAKISDANLSMMNKMQNDFNVHVGLSDHTMGSTAPIVAVALGAKMVEKHFIIDRSIGGPDASFSLNEIEFKQMVLAIRDAESSLGDGAYDLSEDAKRSRAFMRSLYFSEDIKQGDIIKLNSIKSVRPSFGLHPKYMDQIIGKFSDADYKIGDRVPDSLL